MEYLLLLLIAELFEAWMHHSKTLFGVLENHYSHYAKSIFIFFLYQPGFYVLLFIVLDTGILNASMIFLLAIKIFDLFFKMELIKKVFLADQVSPEISEVLLLEMPPWSFLMGVSIYLPLLYYAIL